MEIGSLLKQHVNLFLLWFTRLHHPLSRFIQQFPVNWLDTITLFFIYSYSFSYSKLAIFHCLNHLGKCFMTLTPCSCCGKANWLLIYKVQFFIARSSTTELFLILGTIIKSLTKYKGIVLNNNFNFEIKEILVENIPWRVPKLPDLPHLTNVIILSRINNIFNDSAYNIQQRSMNIGVCFWICSPNVKIYI